MSDGQNEKFNMYNLHLKIYQLGFMIIGLIDFSFAGFSLCGCTDKQTDGRTDGERKIHPVIHR